ncbi:D-alanine--D-alanine ligase [Candidatus Bipolaricaulota bacterium]|nr:D-alanine--D-alanine ligase [Candidatus Bipolaricaulota bacterium]
MVDNSDKLDICVLMGGTSSEREVSLTSGKNVYEALVRGKGRFNPICGEFSREEDLLDLVTGSDLVFNCLHGGIGEDGTVQLLLDLLDISYTGSGPLASSIAMDKLYSKKAFEWASVDVPNYLEIDESSLSRSVDRVLEKLGFPVVVKPVGEGSSRGVRIVDDGEELFEEVKSMKGEYGKLFAEQYIPGTEVTAGLIQEEGELVPLPLVELAVKNERFYNYKAKYTVGETEFIVPARIPGDTAESVKSLAMKVHQEFGCSGYSRVDFIIDSDGNIYGLEVNTLPGMTETSDLPLAAKETDISFNKLVEKMVLSAL